MSGPSPSGSVPKGLPPTSPPGVPSAGSDRGASAALAGFLCALVSLVASLGALVLASGTNVFGNVPLVRRLGPDLQRLHAVLAPGSTSGEGMLLFTAAFLAAVVGFSLSLGGRRSPSRRLLTVSGMLLSSIVVVCFCFILVELYIGWSQAFRYGAFPGNDL